MRKKGFWAGPWVLSWLWLALWLPSAGAQEAGSAESKEPVPAVPKAAVPVEPKATAPVAPDEPVPSPERMIVVIDPGHGGHEPGCTGVAGTREKVLVMQIAERVRATLEELPGYQVIMTRAKDQHISLWDRVDLANRVQADLFISIHANAFVRPGYGGVETFFHSVEASDEEARRVAKAENETRRKEVRVAPDPVQSILADIQRAETLRDSSRFAHLVQAQLAQVLPFSNLGVKQADFVVLRGTHMPSVLLELGFLTNRREEKILRQAQIQERIAQAIRLAVIDFRRLMLRKRVEAKPVEGPRP